MTKLCIHFLAFRTLFSLVGGSVCGSEMSRFVGDETRMQTWRRTELLQML